MKRYFFIAVASLALSNSYIHAAEHSYIYSLIQCVKATNQWAYDFADTTNKQTLAECKNTLERLINTFPQTQEPHIDLVNKQALSITHKLKTEMGVFYTALCKATPMNVKLLQNAPGLLKKNQHLNRFAQFLVELDYDAQKLVALTIKENHILSKEIAEFLCTDFKKMIDFWGKYTNTKLLDIIAFRINL